MICIGNRFFYAYTVIMKKTQFKIIILFLLFVINPLSAIEKKYQLNIHIISRSEVEGIIYQATTHQPLNTIISRIGVSFHSIVNPEKQTETFAIDHCLNPGEHSARHRMAIVYRSTIKEPVIQCEESDFFSLTSFSRMIRKDHPYIRLSQHSDRLKMFSEKGFGFHWDYKYGPPTQPKKLTTNIKVFYSRSCKSLASRMNRWFAHASKPGYTAGKKTMKPIDNEGYQDFLTGSGCRYGIMELTVVNKDSGAHQAGLMFYNLQDDTVIIIEVQTLEEQPVIYTQVNTGAWGNDVVPDVEPSLINYFNPYSP